MNRRAPSNLGAPVATLPRFRYLAGEIDRLPFASARPPRSLAVDGGRTPLTIESALLEATLTENEIVAVEKSGNSGLPRRNPLERQLRDVLASRVHAPQADSARLAAGRAALELVPAKETSS